MTPAARVAAAIEVLDTVFAGSSAEKALTGWGRTHRFAGSKDRAAIRDHVFQALRCKSSYGWLGGGSDGRAVMIGAMRDAGQVAQMFTGEGHAPAPLAPSEEGAELGAASRSVRLDLPDWMLSLFDDSFGAEADAVLSVLQRRAPVVLRVNRLRGDAETAMAALTADGVGTVRVEGADTALLVTENPRRVVQSQAYATGLVELQDTSSQVAVASLGLGPHDRVLDYCAGGGGKALAMAAEGAKVTAHDIDPRRMVDLAPRATRAGVEIAQATRDELDRLAPFDVVFCDAPCSGSGTWRRTPEAKWDLTADRLAELTEMQDDVLANAAPLVRKGGRLIYATCSVFGAENSDRVAGFLAQNGDFSCPRQCQISPSEQGDGFFYAHLVRA